MLVSCARCAAGDGCGAGAAGHPSSRWRLSGLGRRVQGGSPSPSDRWRSSVLRESPGSAAIRRRLPSSSNGLRITCRLSGVCIAPLSPVSTGGARDRVAWPETKPTPADQVVVGPVTASTTASAAGSGSPCCSAVRWLGFRCRLTKGANVGLARMPQGAAPLLQHAFTSSPHRRLTSRSPPRLPRNLPPHPQSQPWSDSDQGGDHGLNHLCRFADQPVNCFTRYGFNRNQA